MHTFAKSVTLGKTHWSDTNRVMLRNRRIGCSVSGVVNSSQIVELMNLRIGWNDGYDVIQEWDAMYSDWFAYQSQSKLLQLNQVVQFHYWWLTSLHYLESRFYIRRIRVSKHSELLEPMKKVIK